MVVSHEELYEAIARDGDVRANSVMCEFLAQPGIATAMQALCSALVRAAFVWRLEWTQQPPRDWWWPMLEMVTAQSEDWPMEVYHLPAAFLPPHEILRLAPILLPTSEWAAARLSLCEGASPEVLAELCRLAPPQRAGPLLTVLRHRRDLSTIAPALMPALLGHANPEMARFGLELATGMTQASRPR
jgi:hypothetical protein